MNDFVFVSEALDGSYSVRAEESEAQFALQSIQLHTHIPTVSPSRSRLYCSQGLRAREGCREVDIELIGARNAPHTVERFVFPLGVNGVTFEMSRGDPSAPAQYKCRAEHPVGRIIPSLMSLVAGGRHIPWPASFTAVDSHTLLFPADGMPDVCGVGSSPGLLLCRTIGRPEDVFDLLNGWLRTANGGVSRPTVEFGYERQSSRATLSVSSTAPDSQVGQVVVCGDALAREMGLMGTTADVGSTAVARLPWAVGMQVGVVRPGFYSHSTGPLPFYVGEAGAPLDLAEEVQRALNPLRLQDGAYGTLQLAEEDPIVVQIPAGEYTVATMRQMLDLVLPPVFEARRMRMKVGLCSEGSRLRLESSHDFRFSCEALELPRLCPLARVQTSGVLAAPRLACTCVVEEHPDGGLILDHVPYVVEVHTSKNPWQVRTERPVAFRSGDVVQLRSSKGAANVVAVVESIDVVDRTASCVLCLRPNGHRWDLQVGMLAQLSPWQTQQSPALYGGFDDGMPASSLGMCSFDTPWPAGSTTSMWSHPPDVTVEVYTGRSTTGIPWARVRAQDGTVMESNAVALGRQFRLQFRGSNNQTLRPEEVRAGTLTLRFA